MSIRDRTIATLLLAPVLLAACQKKEAALRCPDALEFQKLPLDAREAPPPRFDHAMAVDAEGKQVFLFGGRDGTELREDLWVFDSVVSRWHQVETVSSPAGRSGHSLIYDPSSKRLVLFGGFRYDSFGNAHFQRELWTYAEDEGWSREFFQVGPRGRAWHTAAVANKSMVLFGGFEAAPYYYRNDVWLLNLNELSFKRLATDGGPRMAGSPTILPVAGSESIFVFGRMGVSKPKESGLWLLEPEWDRWSDVEGAYNPEADYTLSAANPWEQTILVLKGPAEEEVGWEVWIFDGKERQWCTADAEGGPVTPTGMVCAADPERKLSWICFGGARRNQVSAETWMLMPESED